MTLALVRRRPAVAALAAAALAASLVAVLPTAAEAADQPPAPVASIGWAGATTNVAEAGQGDSLSASYTSAGAQHKTWYAAGTWWALMKNPSGAGLTIHRLDGKDSATPTWVDTAVVVDSRDGTSGDTLFNGTYLFTVTHVVSKRSTNYDAITNPGGAQLGNQTYLTRYAPSGSTWVKSWTVPVFAAADIARSYPSVSLAQENDGQIIIAFAQNARPYATGTLASANLATPPTMLGSGFLIQWTGPYQNLQCGGIAGTKCVDQTAATTLTGTDTVAISSSGGFTTVMWSNQTVGAEGFYVARHRASDPYGTGNFYGNRIAAPSTLAAGASVSLVTDPAGGLTAPVYGLVRTSLTGATDPQLKIIKMVPRAGGIALNSTNTGYLDATSNTVTTVADGGARPVLSFDVSTRTLNAFFTAAVNGPQATDSGTNAGVIFRKQIDPATLAVTPDTPRGEPVLFDVDHQGNTPSTSPGIYYRDGLSDPTVSAQPTTSATGTLVLATDSVVNAVPTVTTTRKYWFTDLRKPATGFTADLSASDVSGVTVDFVGVTSARGGSWSWNFGDALNNPGTNTSTLQNPTHVYSDPGFYTVTLTTTNDWGSTTATASILVGNAPTPSFSPRRIAPSVLGYDFYNTSKGFADTVTWSFGDGTAPVTYPATTAVRHRYKLAGRYNVTMTATNTVGSKTIVVPIGVTATPYMSRPTATPYTGRKVLVKWKTAVPNGYIVTSYNVLCVSGTYKRAVVASYKLRATYVTGLVAGRRYSCYVRAYNKLGWGPWSPASLSFIAKR